MTRQLLVLATVVGLLLTGCVKRIPAYDEARRPLTKREIERLKTNKHFTLYALGGAAVSFGASFFIGSLIDRNLDDEQNDAALWGTTAAGTVIGTIVFATQGRNKDWNEAVQKASEARLGRATKELTNIKSKRKQLEDEKRQLEELRKKQEAEKRALQEKLKKEKEKDKPPLREDARRILENEGS